MIRHRPEGKKGDDKKKKSSRYSHRVNPEKLSGVLSQGAGNFFG
jgi:hypothetical protein